MKNNSLIFIVAVFVMFWYGCETVEPRITTGDKLGEKKVKVEHYYYFEVHSKQLDDKMAFFFVKRDKMVIFYQEIFQKILEYPAAGEENISEIRRKKIDGESVVHRKIKQRIVVRTIGRIKNKKFTINDKEITTNKLGVWFWNREDMLKAFDQSFNNSFLFEISSSDKMLKNIEISITRKQLKNCLNVDDGVRVRSSHNEVKVVTVFPKTVKLGEKFTLKIALKNYSIDKYASALVARVVARDSWLNGKNYYYATLAPGKVSSFERTFTVPKNASIGVHYFVVGWNNNSGAAPSLVKQLKIKVER